MVTSSNTFKLADVKKLVHQTKEIITHEDWAKAVDHVKCYAKAHFTQVNCLDRPKLEQTVISGNDLDDEFNTEGECDGVSSSDDEDEDLFDLGEAPSSMLELPGTAQQSSAALAMPGDLLNATDVEGDNDDLCGCCGRRDITQLVVTQNEYSVMLALCGTTSSVKNPSGGFSDYFICISCRSKFCVSFII